MKSGVGGGGEQEYKCSEVLSLWSQAEGASLLQQGVRITCVAAINPGNLQGFGVQGFQWGLLTSAGQPLTSVAQQQDSRCSARTTASTSSLGAKNRPC